MLNFKKCSKCHNLLETQFFHKNTKSKDGFYYYCKSCRQESHTPEYWKEKALKVKQKTLKDFKDPIKTREKRLRGIIKSVKCRAKSRDLSFNLTYEWMNKNTGKYCPVFQKEFIYINEINRKKWSPFSPSIDRINNNLGYTQDNCIIVSRKANGMKNTGTVDEMIKLADFYRNLSENNIEYFI